MEKFTFQLPMFQAMHFMDFLDKIKIHYNIRFETGKQPAPDLIVYFDMVLNDMNFIRVSRALDFIRNDRCIMPQCFSVFYL